MTRPVLRAAPTAYQTDGVTSGSTPPGTVAGDTIVAVQEVDFRPVGDLVAPTGGISDWQPLTAAIKFGDVALRAWIGHAPSDGAKTVTVSQGGGNSGNHLILHPWAGDAVVDAGPTSNGGTANATSLSLPQVDPTVSDAVLVGYWAGGGFSPNPTPASPVTITPPASMPNSRVTARFNEFFALTTGAQDLTSDVATGARAATTSTTTSSGWVGILLAIRASSTAVTKTGSDTATGAETGTVSGRPSGTDTGTGGDTGYVAVPRAGSDTGAGAESGYVASGQSGGDPGAGSSGTASIAGTATGGDSATGAQTGQISAPTTAAPDTGTGTETGTIVLPGGDIAAGTAQLQDLHADVASADSGSGAEGGYVETRWGDLVISLFAITDDGPVPLPDYQDLTLAPTRNGPGSITVIYPTAGLNFDTLRDNTVGDDDDLEVEIWTIGSPLGALRGYLQEGAGDDVAEGAGGSWTFTGAFLELRMSEAIVYPQPLVGEATLGPNVEVPRSSVTSAQWNRLTVDLGYIPNDETDPSVYVPQKVRDAVVTNATSIPVLADPKRELVISAATPGEMIGFILAQARARGALTDITTSFTADHDTAGNPWPTLVTTRVSPGATYESVLNLLAQLGRAEWSMSWTGSAPCLNLWVAGERGTDLSAGLRPIVLRAGRNLAEAPRKWSVRASPTAMLGIGAEGYYADTADPDAEARRGRRIEASTSSQNLADGDAVLAYAQRRLSTNSDGTLEVTLGLALLPGEPRPLVGFDVGDWVYSSFGPTLDRYRVVEWSLSINAARSMAATVTLNDAFVDEVVRQRQQLDAISGGAVVVGTSQPAQDTGVPTAPEGLVVGSSAFFIGQDVYASVQAGWQPVQVNTDGSAATDLAGYKVMWRLETDDETQWKDAFDTPATQGSFTVAAGLPIYVRVQAYDTHGNRSEWATLAAPHTTEDDADPPGVPSTVIGANYLGNISFTWDGLTADGADMYAAYPDFRECELHVSAASNFTPDATTLIDRVFGKGSYTYSKLPDGSALGYGVTYFGRLVAVDLRGNRSGPSGQGSAVPGQLLSPDIFAGAVGTAALADAVITTAKIADLAVNDAKIGSLSVGKLTAGLLNVSMVISNGAIIAGDPTKSHVRTDSSGLRLMGTDSTTVVAQLLTSNGSAMVSGEYRTTSGSGARMVINPGGSAPNEMRFYPSSTAQYARLKPLTSVATGYENQAGITMKAYSARSDMQSGEVSAFPSYASIAWADEMDGGAVTARIAASQAENFIGGQRTRIVADPSAGGDFRGFLSVGADNGFGTGYNASTVLTFTDSQGNGTGNARLRNFDRNSGIQFDTGIVSIVQTSGAAARFQAATFENSSSREHKTAIGDVDFDVLGAIRGAQARKYRRTDEQDSPQRVGLIAEELPAALTVDMTEGRGLGVDLYALIATVWDGLRQVSAQVDEMKKGKP